MTELTLNDLTNVTKNSRNTVLTDDVKEIIHEMVKEGSSIGKIAKACEVPYQYVYNYLKRYRARLEKEEAGE